MDVAREHRSLVRRVLDSFTIDDPVLIRQQEYQMPPRSAGGWGGLWWATWAQCRAWHQAAQRASTQPLLRTHPMMQRYAQALAWVLQRYRANEDWHRPVPETVMAPSFFTLFRLLFLSGFVFRPLFVPHAWPTTGVGWGVYSAGALLAAASLWSLVSHSPLGLWWVAGPPWWSPDRRVARLLRRVVSAPAREFQQRNG